MKHSRKKLFASLIAILVIGIVVGALIVLRHDTIPAIEPDHMLDGAFPFQRGTLAVSANGRWLAVANSERDVGIWDRASGSKVQTFQVQGEIRALAWSTDAAYLAIATFRNVYPELRYRIVLWDITRKEEYRVLIEDKTVLTLQFLHNRPTLLAGRADGVIRIWDIETPECVSSLIAPSNCVYSLAITHDREQVFAGYKHEVVAWDLAGERRVWTAGGFRGWSTSVTLSPDGRRLLAVFSKEGTMPASEIVLLDSTSGAVLYKITGSHTFCPAFCMFLPGEKHFLVLKDNGLMEIRDTASSKIVHNVSLVGGEGLRWAASPDNQLLAGAGPSGIACWQANSLTEVFVLKK